MYNSIRLLLLTIVIISMYGCSHDHKIENEVHEHPTISVTQYTDFTEIFMEYPTIVTNNEVKFLIHLTDLKNFKAVTQGVLQIELKSNKGVILNITADEPTRPGIYIPKISFATSGIYTMKMTLTGNQVSDKIIVNNIIVHATEDEVPHVNEEESSSISFLKEQQWKINFANEPVSKRLMQQSVRTTGEIIPKPENFSKVVSPISGIISNKNNSQLKRVGMFVKKGAKILNLSPTADFNSNIQKIKNDFLLAKSEFERVESLYNINAVSKKRYDEVKSSFESKRSSYTSIIELLTITENGYSILAPISGYIENTNFSLGSYIEPGQELFTIINPSRLILQANVPSLHSDLAMNSMDASFRVEGIKNEFSIRKLNGKKISVSSSITKSNRTIPVYYEFDNPNNRIKIGMYTETFIKSGSPSEYISIPELAIINEDGLKTAYVQLEGESFEKRILRTGIVDNGYIQILDGLKVGERVVIEGAYQVRLAALSPDSEIGHGHVH